MWSWTEAEPYWQARAYPPLGWVIWPASLEGGRRGRGTLGPDLVNAREMARRVVLGGYGPSMGAHQIWKLARTDPNFPASWPTGGTERLWSWSRAERSYWQPRQPSTVNRRCVRLTERGPGVAPDSQAAAKPTLVVAVAPPQVTGLPHAADQVHRAVAAVHEAARRGAELAGVPGGLPGADARGGEPRPCRAAGPGCRGDRLRSLLEPGRGRRRPTFPPGSCA